tara:strand:- start:25 stop:669 length:645 start_codon:yes stop_codon:yes gene_type:complete
MKITRKRLISLIKEAMYDPRQGLQKRQQAYSALPLEDQEAIDPLLSSDDEFSREQGEMFVDSMTDYQGRFGGKADREDYDMIDVNYILSEIPELARVRDEVPDIFNRVIHTIRSGYIHVRSSEVSKGVVPTLSDTSTIQVYDISSIPPGGTYDPKTSLARSHWHNYVYDRLNQNHPPIGAFQNDPKNREESQQAARKLIQFMLDQGAQVDLETV